MYIHGYNITYIVFWCISSGNCCSELLCKTWGEYFSDTNECRSGGAVDRLTTKYLSRVPFFGLSSLYRGNMFDGWCEVINAVMAVISLLTCCCCHTDHRADRIAVCIAYVTAILDLAKFIHMAAMGSVDKYEIFVIIASILLICLYYRCASCMRSEAYGICAALVVTFGTGILETLRDLYTAAYDEKDGNDCPFI